jgi:hypothetical protein
MDDNGAKVRNRNATISLTEAVPAPPTRVYNVLADYHRHHPAIVPADVFRRVDLMHGGVGAGTRFELESRLMGRTTVARFDVTEPEPGRVLRETTTDGSIETTFTVDPIDEGRATRLTLATEYTLPGRLMPFLLRGLTGNVLRGVFRREIANIARYIAEDRDLKEPE